MSKENFYDAYSSGDTPRYAAEWEDNVWDGVMIAWPHRFTDWAYMLDEIQACYVNLAKAIVRRANLVVVAPDCSDAKAALASLPQDKIVYVECPTNDTWTRDYGPVCSVNSDGTSAMDDFKFNGWGLKFAANHDNLVTERLWGDFPGYFNHRSVVLEGGSIDFDGKGCLLTTSKCLLSPNRNDAFTKSEIATWLTENFFLSNILWIDHGHLEGDDTDSHVDTLARFAPHDTIVYVGCDDPTDPHAAELRAMAEQLRGFLTPEGQPYNLIELPLPDPIYDEDGNRLPATYANYLPLNGAVLLPVYGQQRKDLLATQILKIAYPHHEIVTVDCRALIKQHGSLHCATMQLTKDAVDFLRNKK